MQRIRNISLDRVKDYAKLLIYHYLHEQKSLESDRTALKKPKKSIRFLVKSGRFYTVGLVGLAINYVISIILANHLLNLWYLQSSSLGIIISITTNFLMNKMWTFEDRDFTSRRVLGQYILFVVLCSIGAGIQLSLVFVFVEYSNIQYSLSLILAVLVASLSNFLLNKKITFCERLWE